MPTAMLSLIVILLLAGCSMVGWFSLAAAQLSIHQQSDGTTTILSPLGGQEAIHSDAHGNKGVTHQGSGLPSHRFSSPHGAAPQSITPFDSPVPPHLITPAPLLPIHPRGMATPQPQSPAASGGSFERSPFSGRSGR